MSLISYPVTTIVQLCEPGMAAAPGAPRRLRVCYFVLEPGPPRTLVPRAHAGRAGAPTVSFDHSTRAGQFLLTIADDGWTVIDDTGQLGVPVWWDEDRQYAPSRPGPCPVPAASQPG